MRNDVSHPQSPEHLLVFHIDEEHAVGPERHPLLDAPPVLRWQKWIEALRGGEVVKPQVC